MFGKIFLIIIAIILLIVFGFTIIIGFFRRLLKPFSSAFDSHKPKKQDIIYHDGNIEVHKDLSDVRKHK